MNDIKMILFDLCGVLVELDDISTMWAEQRGRYTDAECWRHWLLNEDVQRIDRGQMEVEAFLQNWKATWNLKASLEELIELYRDLVRGEMPGALELVKECKDAGFAVGCLSNLTAGHWPHVRDAGFGDLFEHTFISCLVGHCKPEIRAYEFVLENCPFKSAEILFLDDNIVNVEPARELGFQGQVVKGPQEARAELKALNLI